MRPYTYCALLLLHLHLLHLHLLQCSICNPFDQQDWTQIMEVGPVAYARMTQAVANDVIKRDAKGSVVNVSSISAHIAQPNRWTYNAAKGAVRPP